MIVRGDGWEVNVRTIHLDSTHDSWRPVVFFMAIVTDRGVIIQVWYLDHEGKLAVSQNNKLRQVGT